MRFTYGVTIVFLLSPLFLSANVVRVRFVEGLSRGFLVLSSESGQKIGDGESQQVAHADRVETRLTIRFTDGSLYDDRTTFSQQTVFHLLTDHVIQRGPSFKISTETLIDTLTGQVKVRYTDSHKKEKMLQKHMALPADLANGMIFTLVKNLDPRATQTSLPYLAITPQPRLVTLLFRSIGEDTFTTDTLHEKSTHYIMSVKIGGVYGLVASLVNRKPSDTDIWVLTGEAPSFAGWRGPLYGEGPIWKISLISPVLSARP